MDPLPLTPAQAAAKTALTPSATTHRAAIALGSNLGDRAATLASAVAAIARLPSTAIIATSRVIETAPIGSGTQSPYLNASVTITTGLLPRPLLDGLLEIEQSHGRTRNPLERWGPRTLDLDLLLYDDLTLHEPGLDIPHPRMHERAFVLEHLSEIAGDWIVPGSTTVKEMFNRMKA